MKSLKSIVKILIIMISLYCNSSCSQQRGNRVNSKIIGVSFVIPEGWVGQETQVGYMLKSNTMAGFVLISKNNMSDINTMLYEAKQGFTNDNLNYLQLVGNVENFNNTGVGGEYHGMMEGVSAKGYMVGVLNNMGLGVSIMTVTTSDYYSNMYRQLCIDIASSVTKLQNTEYSQNTTVNQSVRATKKANKTEELFAGARLSYINSGDGYGTKIVIDLCEQGYFYHSSYDSMAVDTGGYSGGYGDESQGAGKWSIIEKTNQLPILQLKFNNGELYAYYITLEDGKTYLDNRRYFREYGNERGARCN